MNSILLKVFIARSTRKSLGAGACALPIPHSTQVTESSVEEGGFDRPALSSSSWNRTIVQNGKPSETLKPFHNNV